MGIERSCLISCPLRLSRLPSQRFRNESCLGQLRSLAQGDHQSEVARRVGVHLQSVSRWALQIGLGRSCRVKESRTGGAEIEIVSATKQILRAPTEAFGDTSLRTLERVLLLF